MRTAKKTLSGRAKRLRCAINAVRRKQKIASGWISKSKDRRRADGRDTSR
jgi:hypothetical protein